MNAQQQEEDKHTGKSKNRRTGKRWTDLPAWSVQQPHRMGGASCGGVSGITDRVRAVESADAVEAEAVGAVVGPVEDGRWGVTGDWLTGPLQPAAILRTLAFERTSERGAAGRLLFLIFFYSHTLSQGSWSLHPLPLGFVGDVIARPALVLAQRSHLQAGLIAALRLQHGVGHRGRGRTAKLTQGFWEGPQTVFHAGQGVVGTCGNMDRKRKAENKRKACAPSASFSFTRAHCNNMLAVA